MYLDIYFFKNFGTSRIDTYRVFGHVLCIEGSIKGNVSIGSQKIIQKALIRAVAELPGMDRGQDMVDLRFRKILWYEKFFIFLDF